MSGCSSGVEHNLAKVGVERSNRFTRSNFLQQTSRVNPVRNLDGRAYILWFRDRVSNT